MGKMGMNLGCASSILFICFKWHKTVQFYGNKPSAVLHIHGRMLSTLAFYDHIAHGNSSWTNPSKSLSDQQYDSY